MIYKAINYTNRTASQHFLLKPSFYMLFQIFMIGSVAGFIFEGIWSTFKHGSWEHHAATIWGPFCIIYGAGAVLIYLISYILRNRNVLVQIVSYMLVGSIIEYYFSLFQEIFFGSVSWDYSGHFLNIGGRVSLKMTLIWGVLGLMFANFIFPYLCDLIFKLISKPAYLITGALIIFMCVNLIATCMTVTRWRTRQNNIPPSNRVEQLIDSVYGDAKMERLFPNMCFVKK